LTLVPVLALELGASLALVLVQVVSAAGHPAPKIAPVVELSVASKRARAKRSATRRLGQQARVSKVDAENKVMDMLRAKGGKLEDASARGVARLIGGKKSTGHRAVAGLLAAGVVVKAGGVLTLAA
jgi:hypothetical protein